ncbi:MAG: hypothetical protein KDK70_33270, partial [Myxococcales bacterium]|nr:hypothetical protein [Myxococcales bacterium]
HGEPELSASDDPDPDSDDPAPRRVARWGARWGALSAPVTWCGMVLVTLLLGVLAWQRRWISDDGLIVVRTVRQILAGHGPVYNAIERAESSTSTLWTAVLTGVGAFGAADPAPLAVAVGGGCAVLGLFVALDGTRRLHRRHGHQGPLLVAGALVPVAVPPFWDFATSGLETGLGTLWLAAIWWLLVTLEPHASGRRRVVTALVIGLGPLVRPDFGICTLVFGAAAWSIVAPSRRDALRLVAVALALPLAYEIFRAGYYGTLVPLPALAKSAASPSWSSWSRGLGYLLDFVLPHHLWLPFGVLALLLARAWLRGRVPRPDRLVILAPVLSAVLLLVYVVSVGGDFMHGRMCLPPALLLLLPGLLWPLRRESALALLAIAAWAVVVGTRAGAHEPRDPGRSIWDERAGYVQYTKAPNPIHASDFVGASPAAARVARAVRDGERLLIIEGGRRSVPLSPGCPADVVFAVGRLGMGGAATPLDAIVADTNGLASPLGARITPTRPGVSGHEKKLPIAWLLAEHADPQAPTVGPRARAAAAAARRAMRCGELAELLESVRAPLTPRRFWANLVGSWRRTWLVIPADPHEAEERFCAR